ncbi:MAG: cell wall-binding repeat-containing protein [Acidimicrobiaceae bacterium]|nr:cell wall-binding repeat-containing protein [Acidimicrobiaceae bacterium]
MSPPSSRPRRSPRRLFVAMFSVALAGSVLFAPQPAGAQSASTTVLRVSGASVYALATNVAGGSCDSEIGSHSVALASGENWPDALAGAALDRPLLLTKQAFLPAATRDYLGPCASHPKAKVIILGGPAAVSESVAETLRGMGYRVDRFAGDDRYATARRVARTFAPDKIETVYLASGVNFADAAAAAPSVTIDNPLILTTPDELHDEARRFLTNEDREVASVTILGGTAAISTGVEEEITELGIDTDRIAGADRYETAALIARRAFSISGCYPVTDVAVASGTVPFGGLAAGAVRGPCEPLLLAPGSDQPVPETLGRFGQDWRLAIGSSAEARVTGIGPSSVIPTAALSAVATGILRGSGTGGDSVTSGLGWNAVAPAVVQIRCVSVAGGTTRSGSGFVVGDGRHIVTNEHVVHDDQGRPCIRIRAYVGGTFEQAPEKFLPVSIVRASEKHDLALLTTDPDIDPLPTVTIATEPLQAGETLIALGYPSIGGDTMTLTTGRYSGIQVLDGVTWIKTDTPIAPGSSGGPVFNDRREVVGVSTLLRLAIRGQAGTIGSLSLLATTEDLQALLDGDIGE